MTEKEIRENLARNIKTFRAIRGFSQAELAEKSDISVAFMSQIECANKFPSPAVLAQISNALDVKVSELFSEKENVKSDNFKFMLDAMRSVLNGQMKSFETFCEQFSNAEPTY